MSGDESVSIGWDPHAAAWRLDARPAGPAGCADLHLAGASFRFDWIDPSRFVDALVLVDGDTPDAAVPQQTLDIVAQVCGDEVARALVDRSGGRSVDDVTLAAPDAGHRTTAGRLALALELAGATPAPTWWNVEAAWLAGQVAGRAAAAALTDVAFDLVDGMPTPVLEELARAQLADPLRLVLVGVGLSDNDLPGALRLSERSATRSFDALMGAPTTAPPRPLHAPSPAFRSGGRAAAGDGAPAVEWSDVPTGALREAWAAAIGDDTVRVTVQVAGSGGTGLAARLVDASGRVPTATGATPLRPSRTRGGVTTMTVELPAGPGGVRVAGMRVELVGGATVTPLPLAAAARRHATNVARTAATHHRTALAELRRGTDRGFGAARDAAQAAARLWSVAADAWLGADGPVGADGPDAAGHAAACGELARRAAGVIGVDAGLGAGDGMSPGEPRPGWADAVAALTRDLLVDPAAVGASRPAAEWASFAAMAESVDDVELAARFRADQARTEQGPRAAALARLATRHFATLGERPPADVVAIGEQDR